MRGRKLERIMFETIGSRRAEMVDWRHRADWCTIKFYNRQDKVLVVQGGGGEGEWCDVRRRIQIRSLTTLSWDMCAKTDR